MSKVNDIVSWIMIDDKILKLQKKNETYDISDKVFDYLKGKNLLETLEDKTVEVEIDEKQGQTGVITHLALSDSKEPEPKKEEIKTVTPPVESGLAVKEVTVGGVSAKGGVKLKEDKENDTWYDLDSTIDIQKFKKECTGKVVELTVAPQDKGNDVIKGYILKEEKKEEPKEESTKKSYNNTGNSIEAQASLKCAKAIVASMVTPDSKPDFVLSLITKISQHAYQTIQDLKNKE